ncbi:MAG: hypothetical protein Q8936_19345 [Bacillota bacterium]|nr:hypothetical protein [Bacillota bacterium]
MPSIPFQPDEPDRYIGFKCKKCGFEEMEEKTLNKTAYNELWPSTMKEDYI